MSSIHGQALCANKTCIDPIVSISQEKCYYRPGNSWKATHPQLAKIISKMNPPSPCKLVRDREQPISGCILKSITVHTEVEAIPMPKLGERETIVQSKKSLSFVMENSSILKRRVNRVAMQ
ncbi:unnamed protein product [Blepharisma stoltei]|uniref:Uncharacterized protein n=1 Tax=Blepharisma stoltei TaxID=1481888 RepID=A0AAU9JP65_9CILI|nr:unnamed protein product [Blepharisma stoltei]